MIIQSVIVGCLHVLASLSALPLAEQFVQAGFLEIKDSSQGSQAYDYLYVTFDEFTRYLQKNPALKQKLFLLKERFIRTKERNLYSTDFFGLFDESERKGRHQIAFYYSTHFHTFITSNYPEIDQIPEMKTFLEACREIQKPYGDLFEKALQELALPADPPSLLFKVVKYLPDYSASKPHYDGSLLTLFLDSTDNDSLLLSPYKNPLNRDDFFSAVRVFERKCNQNSILLIPGAHLTEFSIYPTPHIVLQSGKIRYAAIAFAMKPYHLFHPIELTPLPSF